MAWNDAPLNSPSWANLRRQEIPWTNPWTKKTSYEKRLWQREEERREEEELAKIASLEKQIAEWQRRLSDLAELEEARERRRAVSPSRKSVKAPPGPTPEEEIRRNGAKRVIEI